MPTPAYPETTPAGKRRIRVLIVDDSALVRMVHAIAHLHHDFEPLAGAQIMGGAVLDQPASLLDEVEGLTEPGVAGVQPPDDRLDTRDGRFVAPLDAHAASPGSARTEASRAAFATPMTL